jgi:hypothetical protein
LSIIWVLLFDFWWALLSFFPDNPQKRMYLWPSKGQKQGIFRVLCLELCFNLSRPNLSDKDRP